MFYDNDSSTSVERRPKEFISSNFEQNRSRCGHLTRLSLRYDASTLAPLGMVVSRDELQGRRVAVVDNGYGGSTRQ